MDGRVYGEGVEGGGKGKEEDKRSENEEEYLYAKDEETDEEGERFAEDAYCETSEEP